ncbi:deoxyribonuclease Tat-D [Diplocarpon rosae]|nr:deoxyribonuclease Tat-D [Diplocarpon rosae]
MATLEISASEGQASAFTTPISVPSVVAGDASIKMAVGEHVDAEGVQDRLDVFRPRFVDIGINLTDPIFRGTYHGTQRHEDDLSDVIQRAVAIGCEVLIVTGSDLEHSEQAVLLAQDYRTVYATIGVHPCNAQSLNPSVLQQLEELATKAKEDGRVVAFGEIGLDYDRLELCPKDNQIHAFEQQLQLAVRMQLPLFLHSRAAHADFIRILSNYADWLPKRGVVHSFTGTLEEMQDLVSRGWDIGINGCSLKTEENLAVVKEIPLERLHLETDGPWCEIRPSHASSAILKRMRSDIDKGSKKEEDDPDMGWGSWKSAKKEKWTRGTVVKGRNEPCFIGRVAWAVAGVKGLSIEEVARAAWSNSCQMFRVGGDAEHTERARESEG